MRKFKCTNKRCQHIATFTLPNENDHHPKCIVCNSVMIDFESIIRQDMHERMLQNIKSFGIKGTLQIIDNLFGHNINTRCAYRKILHETVAKFNLEEK